ncbi:hypothetical protein D7I43_28280 [Micromonospora globbae]|uniref:Uncharacterized protein n=1 Tax=Micromonospora globbae TaxID=1894969 RepID=A0A420ETN4_9ACTN|nr:hypothetical protein D7I43_28280 [Micromonospora globbae]
MNQAIASPRLACATAAVSRAVIASLREGAGRFATDPDHYDCDCWPGRQARRPLDPQAVAGP